MQSHIPKCSPETLIYIGMEYKKNRVKRKIPMDDIFQEVCEIFEQDPGKVKSKDRRAIYVTCRSITTYVSLLLSNCTLNEIGKFLGGRDHTTSIAARDRVKGYLEIKDPEFMVSWNLYIENSKIWDHYNDKH